MFKVIGQTAQNRDPGCKTHWTRPEGPRGLWKFPQIWNEQWGLLTTHCTLFIFLLQVQEAHFWRSYSVPGDASGKESACQCRRCQRRGFDPWVEKIHLRRKWQPTPVILLGKLHGWKSLVGYCPCSWKESDTTEHTVASFYLCTSGLFPVWSYYKAVMNTCIQIFVGNVFSFMPRSGIAKS